MMKIFLLNVVLYIYITFHLRDPRFPRHCHFQAQLFVQVARKRPKATKGKGGTTTS